MNGALCYSNKVTCQIGGSTENTGDSLSVAKPLKRLIKTHITKKLNSPSDAIVQHAFCHASSLTSTQQLTANPETHVAMFTLHQY
jgi:hypothetical protein